MDLLSRLASFAIVAALTGLFSTQLEAASPTLTSMSVVPGSIEDSDSIITAAALRIAGDEFDADGGTINFRIKAITNGSLDSPVNTVISNSNPVIWTPPANANGNIAAFTVVAFDGTNESATPVTVTISVAPVNDPPSFTAGSAVSRIEDVGSVTINNWASNISPGPPNESAQSVEFILTNNNSALFSTQPAISPQGHLTFTPQQDENGVALLTVKIRDNGGGSNESPTQNFSITISPVNDPPEITTPVGGIQTSPYPDSLVGTDGAPPTIQAPFNTVTINDVDHLKDYVNPLNEPLNVKLTISRDIDAYGEITTPPSGAPAPTITSTHYIYNIPANSPATVQSALRATRFRPFANAQPVGIYNFNVKIEATDPDSVNATPLVEDLEVASINDTPIPSVTITPSSIPDSTSVKPFRLSIVDPDVNETFSVTITETTPVPLGTIDLTSITGNAAQINQAVQNITYTPLPQTIASQVATFSFSITDIHPGGATGTPVIQSRNLTVTFTNGIPEITGVPSEVIRTTDDPSAPVVTPFPNVSITDSNTSQILTVTLSLDDPAKGTFSGLISNQLTGTAASVTNALRNVVFTPTPNRLAVNQQETAIVTITVFDGLTTRTDSTTEIVITYVNGAPVIDYQIPNGPFPSNSSPALISPNLTTNPPSSLPFHDVLISDEGDVVVTITIDDAAKGTFESPGDRFAPISAGVVRFTGSHTDAQDAIQELKFITNPAYQFPAGQPGRTNFTILATDSVLNQTTRILPIVLISNARNFLVTNTLDTTIVSGSTGTPGSLRHAILNAAPNDVITFALPSYPATIRLNKSNGPLVINKHLSFKGPGADKLTISGDSNSNGNTDSNDVRIFTIYSAVSIEGIRLSRGFDANGGAIFVGRAQPGVPAGSLYLANSTISNSIASNWGGAIDVFDGSIRVENCLFSNNSVSVAAGLGGGAVSLFTHSPCSFLNTTFSANEQRSPNGYGGGAIYVENDTPVAIFQTTVTHCTFAANTDARNRGSSIHSNVSNTRVLVANSVFADFSARNLYVTGGGDILSQGGNLSNDNTTTEYIIGGNPLLFKLLNHGSDIVNTDPQLNTLANVGGETLAHSPKPSSPAIGLGLPNLATTDQRGTVRVTGSPTLPENTDAGAIEFSGNGKIIVHEIAALPASSSDFIEFFNPRNQQEINLTNHEIWIDDVKIRTLTAPLVIQPGFGFVLSNNTVTTPNASTPVILVNPSTPSAPLSLRPRGKIEIRKPGNGAPILNTSYVAVFANKDIPANTDLIYDSDSITLAPQFGGNALVPHRLVQPPPSGSLLGATGDSTSPGADTGNTPLGEPNAYPIAILDRFEVTEDEIANLNVLTNDLDADGSDSLFIIDVNPLENPAIPTTNATALSVAGAPVSIIPNSPAQRGKSIEFNPVTPFNHLPAGARVTDFFAYSIIDVGRGPIASFASGGGAFTLVSSPAHRLANGETITITDSSHAPFNGTYPVSSVTPNSFLIPVTFVSGTNGGLNAFWQADTPRSPTLRDTAMVEVTVLGRNDPPVPAPNSVATQEDTILRILGDATRVGTSPAFDTDANYPLPRQLSSVGIIANDTDPDDGDMPYTNLKLIGVCNALPISSYAPQTTTNLVTVTATDHGLANNTRILISGYGGHPSYNGYHFITLIDEHTFSIPVTYIDNHPTKGLWTLLNDESRLVTTTEMGATATLEIRADRSLTNIVYNPRTSPAIDALAINQPATDRFFYAIEDPQGAVSIAEITVNLTGTNDTTVPGNDPAGLLTLNPSLQPGTNLAQYIADAQIIGIRPSPSSDARNVAILAPGADPSGSQLINSLRQTDEDTAIAFSATSLLANDTDIDLIDSLTIEVAPGQTSSRMGAQISLAPGATAVNYNPANASQLQSLARGEPVIDTFSITIFDGTTRVTSLVAVLVIGVNDSPSAVADSATTTEKSLLQLNSPAIIGNDVEIDQNNSLPDDRKFLLPTGNTSTTVFGAIANANFERRDGDISSFTASGSNPAVTLVNSSSQHQYRREHRHHRRWCPDRPVHGNRH
jgi:VCBS repeat-containing protein